MEARRLVAPRMADVELFKEMKLIVPAGMPEGTSAARFAAYAIDA